MSGPNKSNSHSNRNESGSRNNQIKANLISTWRETVSRTVEAWLNCKTDCENTLSKLEFLKSLAVDHYQHLENSAGVDTYPPLVKILNNGCTEIAATWSAVEIENEDSDYFLTKGFDCPGERRKSLYTYWKKRLDNFSKYDHDDADRHGIAREELYMEFEEDCNGVVGEESGRETDN